MSGKITRLVAREFNVYEETLMPGNSLKVGDKYTYLVDPETGKYYRPIEGWEVVASDDADLADMFVEVRS